VTVHVSPDGGEVVALVEALPAGRFVLGLSGAPGAGKSTLAAALAAAYGVPVVPMDGFHRTNAELASLSRLDAKGAPDTFDAVGYAAVLRRLHGGGTVLAPSFDHDLPDPLPDTIEVPAEAGLVVTEGIYLLLDRPAWREVRRECDAVWHLVVDRAQRIERLVRRHEESGKAPAPARAWVLTVDQANAELVDAAAGAADELLDLSAWSGRLAGPLGTDAAPALPRDDGPMEGSTRAE
jgi:pantothenate kinase